MQKDKCNTLIKLFEIKNPEIFKLKYEQAISGDGSEEHRILTLVSSTLCALLFFYNVSESNTLIMDINGNQVKFNESYFEFKNHVISNPSNMDVTLCGIDQNGNRIILFLESKLIEYYRDCSCTSKKAISNKYLKNQIGHKIYNTDFGYQIEKNEENFMLKSDQISYIDGIKQLISHFIGINNFLNNKYSSKNDTTTLERLKSYIENANTKVYFGTIIFDKRVGDLELTSGKKCLEDYSFRYNKIAKIINDNYKSSRFEMLEDLILYSFFEETSFDLESRIKSFYSLK